MAAFRKSLRALDCSFADEFDSNSRAACILLVRWLEDRKVRELDIPERHLLDDSPEWEGNFQKYLEILGYPLAATDTISEKIYWLITHAVSLEYEDKELGKLDEQSAHNLDGSSISDSLNKVISIIGLERIDGECDQALLNRLFLKLKNSISDDAIEAQKYNNPKSVEKQLSGFPLGFDTGDKVANQVALVMKMLYLSDFRDLQNEVNTLLVLAQEFTANPRLNAALGRVGT